MFLPLLSLALWYGCAIRQCQRCKLEPSMYLWLCCRHELIVSRFCTRSRFLGKNTTSPYRAARPSTDIRLGWMRGAVVVGTLILLGYVRTAVVP